MRVFVAIELDAGVREQLARIRSLPLPGIEALEHRSVRWVEKSLLHLTLRFLGEVEPARILDVTAALREATQGCRPFAFSVVGLGGFPSWQRARVLWAGVRPTAEVEDLAVAVERSLVSRGFPPADRKFSAHVTVARVKAPVPALSRMVVREDSPRFGEQEVAEVVLVESTLTPDGPRYRKVDSAPLGGSRGTC